MVIHTDTFLQDVESSVADKMKVGWDGSIVRKIAMQGTTLRYNVGVFAQVGQQPGKSSSLTYVSKLAYGDFLGFSNPMITLQGVIDLNNFLDAQYDHDANASTPDIPYGMATTAIITSAQPSVTDDAGANAYRVTLRLLQQMYQSGHIFQITDKFDTSATNDVWRLHSLNGVFAGTTSGPSLTSQTIAGPKVMIKGLSVDMNTGVNEGAKLTFSLTLVEVRQ